MPPPCTSSSRWGRCCSALAARPASSDCSGQSPTLPSSAMLWHPEATFSICTLVSSAHMPPPLTSGTSRCSAPCGVVGDWSRFNWSMKTTTQMTSATRVYDWGTALGSGLVRVPLSKAYQCTDTRSIGVSLRMLALLYCGALRWFRFVSGTLSLTTCQCSVRLWSKEPRSKNSNSAVRPYPTSSCFSGPHAPPQVSHRPRQAR